MTDTYTSPHAVATSEVSAPDAATPDAATPDTGALAKALGLPYRPAPWRRWVQSPNAGHLSGLVWGSSRPEVVLVHDLGDSSNGWDAVALASRRELVALDLPGHGRSSVAGSIASPARQAPALLDAIRSLAPTARLVVASGLGAAIALQAAIKRPASVPAILVVDGGPVASNTAPLVDPDGFADLDAVVRRISHVAPGRPEPFVRHLAVETTVPRPDGRLEWRYQLGSIPDELAAWTSVERFGDDPPVPVAVVAAGDEPHDPVVRSILARWPETPTYTIDARPADLIATAPVAVADAIDRHLVELSANDTGSTHS